MFRNGETECSDWLKEAERNNNNKKWENYYLYKIDGRIGKLM